MWWMSEKEIQNLERAFGCLCVFAVIGVISLVVFTIGGLIWLFNHVSLTVN